METSTVESSETRPSRLNAAIAISVALLSTVMGLGKVKDDNIVQAMQQAQSDRVDHWNFYQARNMREEVARAALVQLRLQAPREQGGARTDWDAAIQRYETLISEQAQKKEELRLQALQDQKTYDALNYRDDQFDLADAAISIAIALLAIAALTQFWWLYVAALVPALFGSVMAVAGLAALPLHPQALASLLS
jgi:ribosomal protein S13